MESVKKQKQTPKKIKENTKPCLFHPWFCIILDTVTRSEMLFPEYVPHLVYYKENTNRNNGQGEQGSGSSEC